MRAAIGWPLGGGGAACAESLELPEGVGATAGLGAGSGGGVAQEELARGVGGAGGTGASARGGGTREAAIGAAGPQGSLRSARQGPVAPALLQVSRRGVRRPWTVFRKGRHRGRSRWRWRKVLNSRGRTLDPGGRIGTGWALGRVLVVDRC